VQLRDPTAGGERGEGGGRGERLRLRGSLSRPGGEHRFSGTV